MGLPGWNFVEVARAATEGILNGVWQGTLFVVVVAILIRGLRGAGPTARHLIWLAALGAVAALTVLAASDRLSEVAGTSPEIGAIVAPGMVPADLSPAGILDGSLAPGRGLVLNISQAEWLLVVVLLLAAVSTLKVVRLFVGFFRWFRLRARADSLPRDFEEVVKGIPTAYFRRNPAILVSDELSRPITMGFLHPTILLPRNLSANLTQLELKQVVLHELAHVRRYDDWTNLFQRLLESIFCFNPAVGWIGRRLEVEREIACDEQVVAHFGGKLGYASCLIRLAGSTWPVRGSQYVAGAASTRSQLARRVEAIVAGGGRSGSRQPALALTGGAAVLTLALLMTSRGPTVRVTLAERAEASGYAEGNAVSEDRSTGPFTAGSEIGAGNAMRVGSEITSPISNLSSSEPARASATIGRTALRPSSESTDPEDISAYGAAIGRAELGRDVTPRMAGSDCGLAASGGCIDRGSSADLAGNRPILTLVEAREISPLPVATAGLDERRSGLKVLSSGSQGGPSYGNGSGWPAGTPTPSTLGYSVGGLHGSAAPALPAVLRAQRTSTAWGLLSGVSTGR